MEISGTVIFTDTQKGTSKTGREWQKKIFVISYQEGVNKRNLAFELFGEDRINNNPLRKGQNVTVFYDLESTEWNGRWFTSCNAWKVSKIGDNNTIEPTVQQPMVTMTSDEELPF